MRFTYELTSPQYLRFRNDPNTTGEIDNLGRLLGVRVLDGSRPLKWVFYGRCEGTAEIVPFANSYFLVIQVDKKPWWLLRSVLDWGFRRALV